MRLNNQIQLKDLFIILTIVMLSVYGPSWLPGAYRAELQFCLALVLVTLLYFRWKSTNIKALGLLDQFTQDKAQQDKMIHTQEVMLELSNSMIKVEAFDELLLIILEKAIEVVKKANYGSILIMNEDRHLEFKALVGLSESLFDVRLAPEESYQWQATNGNFKEPVIIEDLLKYTKEFVNEETYTSMKEANAIRMKSTLSAPILIEGRFFGSINIDSDEAGIFGQEDIKIMAYFANQASVAISNHQLYERMHYLSKYDVLTGALNRYQFEEYMEAIFEKSSLRGEPASVALIDLNGFKFINDTYGHTVGDKVLSLFAKQVKDLVGKRGHFSRFGGDEFSIGFWNCDSLEADKKLAGILKEVSKTPIYIDEINANINCTFSYGISEYQVDGRTLKHLLRVADVRMYDQKNKEK